MKASLATDDVGEGATIRPMMEGRPTFRALFEAEETRLLRFAFGLLGQREIAEDLVQEAFMRLHGQWGEVRQPKAWLYRSVRNLALNYRRDHRRESTTEKVAEAVAAECPEGALARMEAAGTLQLIVAELSEEDRQLLQLKYHEGMKYEQISRCTGLSVGNVGYRLHHLLKKLASRLKKLGVEAPEV